MRNVAICGQNFKGLTKNCVLDAFELEGQPVHCGLVHTPDAGFDRQAPENAERVLVKITAFSCNYRDKALILKMAVRGPAHAFYVIGSEFVGQVVECGPNVTEFETGDRVIGNGSYPVADAPGVKPGLPTNNGSKEYQIFHRAKLIKIPARMPDEIAAAFPIGGQTAYSMVRRLNLAPGENVLVTAANSNTSLFAINALRSRDVTVYASTTSARFAAELAEMGVKQLFEVSPALPTFAKDEAIRAVVEEIGGFDAVIDPFFDLYLPKVVEVMGMGGRYITCGLQNQFSELVGQSSSSAGQAQQRIMVQVMLKNLQIIGNCIGRTPDLQQALDEYAAGKLHVQVDRVYDAPPMGPFFNRTYNDRQRFGKVVFRYSDSNSNSNSD